MYDSDSRGPGGGRLNGKIAIITGATSGIGLATARRFAAEGARLVICGRNMQAGESLVAEIDDGMATLVIGDVTDPRTAQEAVSVIGTPDILVNNAAMDFASDLCDTNVNVTG